jgi:hypothetical protein
MPTVLADKFNVCGVVPDVGLTVSQEEHGTDTEKLIPEGLLVRLTLCAGGELPPG